MFLEASTVVFIVIAILFALLTYFQESSNSKKVTSTTSSPFIMYLPPYEGWTNNSPPNAGINPDGTVSLVTSTGGGTGAPPVPQITCPVGTNINIINAFFDVVDPYGSCSVSPIPVFGASCGVASDITTSNVGKVCSTTADCTPGLACSTPQAAGSTGTCTLPVCSTSFDCVSAFQNGVPACPVGTGGTCPTPSATNGGCPNGTVCVSGTCQVDPGGMYGGGCYGCNTGACVLYPLCQNTSPSTGVNKTCGGGNVKPRDASAYLANVCDGKSVCLAGGTSGVWAMPGTGSTSSGEGGNTSFPFGPWPGATDATTRSSLPILPGWGGTTPPGGSGTAAATFNQGYYVHGLYTCVPAS